MRAFSTGRRFGSVVSVPSECTLNGAAADVAEKSDHHEVVLLSERVLVRSLVGVEGAPTSSRAAVPVARRALPAPRGLGAHAGAHGAGDREVAGAGFVGM